MKHNHILIALFAILLGISQAQAQSDRTFVATTGSDSQACGPSDVPCRTFTAALPKTNAGGEVIALDSGVYDSFILVSVSVTLTAAPGVQAALSNDGNSSNRITVNAGSDDRVVLRNLFLKSKPGNVSSYGIGVLRVGVLQIENCDIDGFSAGIGFSLQGSAQVSIKDTIVRNSSTDGIAFFTSSGLIKASIDRSHFDNNGSFGAYSGVNVIQRSRVTVRDSVATGNTGAGFNVTGGDLNLENCEASNNDDGVVAGFTSNTTGTATVSNSIVTNNSHFGFSQAGTSTFNSLGNNTVRRNGTNTSGTINVVSGT